MGRSAAEWQAEHKGTPGRLLTTSPNIKTEETVYFSDKRVFRNLSVRIQQRWGRAMHSETGG